MILVCEVACVTTQVKPTEEVKHAVIGEITAKPHRTRFGVGP